MDFHIRKTYVIFYVYLIQFFQSKDTQKTFYLKKTQVAILGDQSY